MFQALQYLLKLCSHPLLVTGEMISDSFASMLSELFPACSDIVSELHKLHHSPKLVALKEILEECGIGLDPTSSEGMASIGQHRVLIFAQHKVMCLFDCSPEVSLLFSFLVSSFLVAHLELMSSHAGLSRCY